MDREAWKQWGVRAALLGVVCGAPSALWAYPRGSMMLEGSGTGMMRLVTPTVSLETLGATAFEPLDVRLSAAPFATHQQAAGFQGGIWYFWDPYCAVGLDWSFAKERRVDLWNGALLGRGVRGEVTETRAPWKAPAVEGTTTAVVGTPYGDPETFDARQRLGYWATRFSIPALGLRIYPMTLSRGWVQPFVGVTVSYAYAQDVGLVLMQDPFWVAGAFLSRVAHPPEREQYTMTQEHAPQPPPATATQKIVVTKGEATVTQRRIHTLGTGDLRVQGSAPAGLQIGGQFGMALQIRSDIALQFSVRYQPRTTEITWQGTIHPTYQIRTGTAVAQQTWSCADLAAKPPEWHKEGQPQYLEPAYEQFVDQPLSVPSPGIPFQQVLRVREHPLIYSVGIAYVF